MSIAEELREACQAVLDEYEEAPTEYVKGGLDTMYAVLLAWPDRIQAELDKKDAEIAALRAALRENNIEPCERCGSQEHKDTMYPGHDAGLCDPCAHDMGAAK